MKETPKNSLEILKEARIIKAETDKEVESGLYDEVLDRLFQPYFVVENEGTEESSNLISFNEVKLDKGVKNIIERYLKGEGITGDSSLAIGNWRAIDQLKYQFNEREIDIFVLLPKDFKIVFCPEADLPGGSVAPDENIILVPNGIASWGSLAVILHEVGHVKDNQKLERIGAEGLTEGGDFIENEQAERLRKEKEASLFALRKLWRMIRKEADLKRDVILYLKNIAYSSHCNAADVSISIHRSMADFAKDYEIDDNEFEMMDRWDAWQKFKDNTEYKEWKQNAEFADLDEEEEFAAWSEWIDQEDKLNDQAFCQKYFGF